jgi:hypothetical protein
MEVLLGLRCVQAPPVVCRDTRSVVYKNNH